MQSEEDSSFTSSGFVMKLVGHDGIDFYRGKGLPAKSVIAGFSQKSPNQANLLFNASCIC